VRALSLASINDAIARGHSSLLLLLELNDRINDKDCVLVTGRFLRAMGWGLCTHMESDDGDCKTRYFKDRKRRFRSEEAPEGEIGRTVEDALVARYGSVCLQYYPSVVSG